MFKSVKQGSIRESLIGDEGCKNAYKNSNTNHCGMNVRL